MISALLKRIEPVRYYSAAQCRAAMPAALMRNTDIDYPTITAACRQVGQSMADANGKAQLEAYTDADSTDAGVVQKLGVEAAATASPAPPASQP